jgi:hypothetical protein
MPDNPTNLDLYRLAEALRGETSGLRREVDALRADVSAQAERIASLEQTDAVMAATQEGAERSRSALRVWVGWAVGIAGAIGSGLAWAWAALRD